MKKDAKYVAQVHLVKSHFQLFNYVDRLLGYVYGGKKVPDRMIEEGREILHFAEISEQERKR